MTSPSTNPYRAERLGIIMRPDPADPLEAWGTLNPGGVRGPDGLYHLFPRIVAAGNYSRIGRACVLFNAEGVPTGVERRGYALVPQESYEVTPHLGGGVEDPRVTYVAPLGVYVMTYTAFTPPHRPRIALAVSRDLATWTRLGPVRYAVGSDGIDHNRCGNKDGVLFPDVVQTPQGQPAIALLHRPTYALDYTDGEGGNPFAVTAPPNGGAHPEDIWISYTPVARARSDIGQLTSVEGHRVLMGAQAAWEQLKIGSGAPPVRLPYGWLLLYHGVSTQGDAASRRYVAGAAILDLEDPTTVLYRSPEPILVPETPQEMEGIVPGVVFPTATDLHDDGSLDMYYGGADRVIGAARIRIPARLPGTIAEEDGRVHPPR